MKKEVETTRVKESSVPEEQLNDGERWAANMATVDGIENVGVMVRSFDSSSENYETLQSNLRDEFGLIFKNCTLKAEAHEQLHNYLLPLIELFGELTEEGSEKTLGKIKEHLARFDSYFVMDA